MFQRRIGLTVEQPHNGSYYWVIHEDLRRDGRYERVSRASEAFVSYGQALAEGWGILRRMNGQDRERTIDLHSLRPLNA